MPRKTRRGGVKTRSQRKKQDAAAKAKSTARAARARAQREAEIAERDEKVARTAAMAPPSTGAWGKYVEKLIKEDD